MAELSRYAIITTDELRSALGSGYSTSTGKEEPLAQACNDASATIERYLDRLLIARGAVVATEWTLTPITAYFSPRPWNPALPDREYGRLVLREWPLIAVASVYETIDRTYDSSTLLTLDTDYDVSAPPHTFGYVTRIVDPGGFPLCWITGRRTVRITYTAGYSNAAAVPDDLKTVAKTLAAMMWRERDRGMPELEQTSSPMAAKFSAAIITPKMKEALQPFKRPEVFHDYEERIA